MRCTIRYFLVGIALASLASCKTLPTHDWTRPQYTAERVLVQNDEFKKVVNFTGPNCAADPSDSVFLRAWKNRDGEITYQVYVRHMYTGSWRFYDSAWDSNGSRLDVTVISRDVRSCAGGTCSHDEHIGINVSQRYLDHAAMAPAGMVFKIDGKGGEHIFNVPPAYIEGFLSVAK